MNRVSFCQRAEMTWDSEICVDVWAIVFWWGVYLGLSAGGDLVLWWSEEQKKIDMEWDIGCVETWR